MAKFPVRNSNAFEQSEKPLKIVAKFRVLKFNQKFMAYIGINSHRLTESTNEFFCSIVAYFILFNLFCWCVVSSTVFVYQNRENLELALLTALVIVAGLQAGGMFLAVGLKMATVKTLHLRLQEIIDNGQISECDFL